MDAVTELERGREAISAEAWLDAYESLSAADRSDPLAAEDLELLAKPGYMLGRESEYHARHRSHPPHRPCLAPRAVHGDPSGDMR